MRLLTALLPLVALLSTAPAQAQENDRTIVRLSYVATTLKCAQAGIGFSEADVALLSTLVRQDADAKGVSEAERNRLWMLGRMMSASTIDAESCAKARTELPTWFPELAN